MSILKVGHRRWKNGNILPNVFCFCFFANSRYNSVFSHLAWVIIYYIKCVALYKKHFWTQRWWYCGGIISLPWRLQSPCSRGEGGVLGLGWISVSFPSSKNLVWMCGFGDVSNVSIFVKCFKCRVFLIYITSFDLTVIDGGRVECYNCGTTLVP